MSMQVHHMNLNRDPIGKPLLPESSSQQKLLYMTSSQESLSKDASLFALIQLLPSFFLADSFALKESAF